MLSSHWPLPSPPPSYFTGGSHLKQWSLSWVSRLAGKVTQGYTRLRQGHTDVIWLAMNSRRKAEPQRVSVQHRHLHLGYPSSAVASLFYFADILCSGRDYFSA